MVRRKMFGLQMLGYLSIIIPRTVDMAAQYSAHYSAEQLHMNLFCDSVD